MINYSTVSLTDDEAKNFATFQKHHVLIELLTSIGAFDIRGGSVTIHFDSLGRIKVIDKNEQFRA